MSAEAVSGVPVAGSEGPLAGVKVVEFCQLIAGPGAGNALAALGADVVKVEPHGGESAREMGSYGVGITYAHNRGKRSIMLNPRHPEAGPVLDALLGSADVLIQNMRPGTMDSLGLGAEDLRSRFPRLIYASVSGYPAGTAAHPRAGLDIAAQAEGGIMSVTGTADREPQRVGFPVVDEVAAGQLAQGILAALYRRERTGVGALVQTSLLETAVHLQGAAFGEYAASGVEPSRSGNGQVRVAPAADVLELEGGAIVLSAYTPAHWATLCRAIERPEMITDARFADNDARVANRTQMRAALHEALRGHTRDSALALLQGAGLVAGPVNTYADVIADPSVRDADLLQRVVGADGTVFLLPRLPYRIDGVSLAHQEVPAAGEHAAAVLAELGYDDVQIENLRSSGVVGAANNQGSHS